MAIHSDNHSHVRFVYSREHWCYEVGYAVGYEDGVFDEGWIYAQELHNLTANLTYSLDQHKIVASE